MFNPIDTRSITFNLIMVNIIMAVVTYLVGDEIRGMLGLFYPASPLFKPVQVISHMFMHAGMGHLFVNMFALFMFGTDLERVWGPKRYLFFYLVTGFGAVVLHLLVQAIIVYNVTGFINPRPSIVVSEPLLKDLYTTPTVGASGAVFGILVGFGMLFPSKEIFLLFFPVPIQARYLVLGYVLIEIYTGFTVNDNIAHFAHLGGALFGFILIKIWNRNRDFLY